LSFLAVAFLFVRCSDTVEQADSSWLRKIVSVLRHDLSWDFRTKGI
jgi:hypothetical protein